MNDNDNIENYDSEYFDAGKLEKYGTPIAIGSFAAMNISSLGIAIFAVIMMAIAAPVVLLTTIAGFVGEELIYFYHDLTPEQLPLFNWVKDHFYSLDLKWVIVFIVLYTVAGFFLWDFMPRIISNFFLSSIIFIAYPNKMVFYLLFISGLLYATVSRDHVRYGGSYFLEDKTNAWGNHLSKIFFMGIMLVLLLFRYFNNYAGVIHELIGEKPARITLAILEGVVVFSFGIAALQSIFVPFKSKYQHKGYKMFLIEDKKYFRIIFKLFRIFVLAFITFIFLKKIFIVNKFELLHMEMVCCVLSFLSLVFTFVNLTSVEKEYKNYYCKKKIYEELVNKKKNFKKKIPEE